jgi:hypothetical protein
MANMTSYVKQSASAAKIASQYSSFLQKQKGIAVGPSGNIGTIPGVVTAPPKAEDEEIEALDLARVRPGDLITADFINGLIDVVVAVDARLQRIEKLLAPLIEREEKKNASAPAAEGKP